MFRHEATEGVAATHDTAAIDFSSFVHASGMAADAVVRRRIMGEGVGMLVKGLVDFS